MNQFFYTSLVTISSIVLQRLRYTSILQPKILIWDIESIEYIPSQVILRSILNFDDSSVYNLSKMFKYSSEVNKKDFQNHDIYLTNNESSYAFLVVYSLIVKRVKRYTDIQFNSYRVYYYYSLIVKRFVNRLPLFISQTSLLGNLSTPVIQTFCIPQFLSWSTVTNMIVWEGHKVMRTEPS